MITILDIYNNLDIILSAGFIIIIILEYINCRFRKLKSTTKKIILSAILQIFVGLIVSLMGFIINYWILQIEITHGEDLDYTNSIEMKSHACFVKIYYTTNGELIKENGFEYTEEIKIEDLNIDLSEENNKITIAYRANIGGLFFVGEVYEKTYTIVNIPYAEQIQTSLRDDFPNSLDKTELDYIHKNFLIEIDNDGFKKHYIPFPEELETNYKIPSKIDCKFLFNNISNKEIRQIYFKGLKSIKNIEIYTNEKSYKCNLPADYDEDEDNVIEINFKNTINSSNIWIQFNSDEESYEINEIQICFG